MQKVQSFFVTLWSYPLVSRSLHTFWQAALGVLAAGLFAANSPDDMKALVIAAVAAGASAVKSTLVAKYGK